MCAWTCQMRCLSTVAAGKNWQMRPCPRVNLNSEFLTFAAQAPCWIITAWQSKAAAFSWNVGADICIARTIPAFLCVVRQIFLSVKWEKRA